MTLDEAIAHAREVATEQKRRSGACVINDNECDKFSACIKCAEEHEQLAEWLEELKKIKSSTVPYYDGFKEGKQVGYDKVIDDFTGEIKDWQIDIQDNEYDAEKFDFVFERIYEIAEQLKAGEQNE